MAGKPEQWERIEGLKKHQLLSYQYPGTCAYPMLLHVGDISPVQVATLNDGDSKGVWLAELATIGADFYSTDAYGHLSWSPPVIVVHRMLRDNCRGVLAATYSEGFPSKCIQPRP